MEIRTLRFITMIPNGKSYISSTQSGNNVTLSIGNPTNSQGTLTHEVFTHLHLSGCWSEKRMYFLCIFLIHRGLKLKLVMD